MTRFQGAQLKHAKSTVLALKKEQLISPQHETLYQEYLTKQKRIEDAEKNRHIGDEDINGVIDAFFALLNAAYRR